MQEMILPLVVLDVYEEAAEDRDCTISMDDFRTWEQRQGPIPEGAFVANGRTTNATDVYAMVTITRPAPDATASPRKLPSPPAAKSFARQGSRPFENSKPRGLQVMVSGMEVW